MQHRRTHRQFTVFPDPIARQERCRRSSLQWSPRTRYVVGDGCAYSPFWQPPSEPRVHMQPMIDALHPRKLCKAREPAAFCARPSLLARISPTDSQCQTRRSVQILFQFTPGTYLSDCRMRNGKRPIFEDSVPSHPQSLCAFSRIPKRLPGAATSRYHPSHTSALTPPGAALPFRDWYLRAPS